MISRQSEYESERVPSRKRSVSQTHDHHAGALEKIESRSWSRSIAKRLRSSSRTSRAIVSGHQCHDSESDHDEVLHGIQGVAAASGLADHQHDEVGDIKHVSVKCGTHKSFKLDDVNKENVDYHIMMRRSGNAMSSSHQQRVDNLNQHHFDKLKVEVMPSMAFQMKDEQKIVKETISKKVEAKMNFTDKDIHNVNEGENFKVHSVKHVFHGSRGVLKVGSDCSGLATESHALDMLNVKHEHSFLSEAEPALRHYLEAKHTEADVHADVVARVNHHPRLSTKTVQQHVDLYVFGAPCQPYSPAGKKQGPEGCATPSVVELRGVC